MAKVSVPDLQIGNQITTSDFNTFITEMNAVGGDINQNNVRDEGIDRRNIANSTVQVTDHFSNSTIYHREAAGPYSIPNQTTWPFAILFASGNPALVLGGSATLECDNSDWIIVQCSFTFSLTASTVLASFNKGSPQANFRLCYEETQSATTGPIGGSIRRFNSYLVGGSFHVPSRSSCTIVAAVEAPTTSSGTNRYNFWLDAKCYHSKDTSITTVGEISQVQLFARVIKK